LVTDGDLPKAPFKVTNESLREFRILSGRWLFGVEQYTPQTGRPCPGGVRIWTY
jgi:hypothetical protein